MTFIDHVPNFPTLAPTWYGGVPFDLGPEINDRGAYETAEHREVRGSVRDLPDSAAPPTEPVRMGEWHRNGDRFYYETGGGVILASSDRYRYAGIDYGKFALDLRCCLELGPAAFLPESLAMFVLRTWTTSVRRADASRVTRRQGLYYPLRLTLGPVPAGDRLHWEYQGRIPLHDSANLPHTLFAGETLDRVVDNQVLLRSYEAQTIDCPLDGGMHVEFTTEPVRRVDGEITEGDLDGDGRITGLDIAQITARFGHRLDEVPDPRVDVNLDGEINGLDVAALKKTGVWGEQV